MRQEKGLSFFGMLFLLAIVAGIVSMGIKIIPTYIDFMTISEATRSMLGQPRVGLMDSDNILKKIENQLSINNIRLRELGKDAIVIKRDDRGIEAVIDYVVEKPVFDGADMKIFLTMRFARTHEISSPR